VPTSCSACPEEPICPSIHICYVTDFNIAPGTFHSEACGGNVKVSADAGATWSLIYPQGGYDDDAAYGSLNVGGGGRDPTLASPWA
jgi:hypothetical protein